MFFDPPVLNLKITISFSKSPVSIEDPDIQPQIAHAQRSVQQLYSSLPKAQVDSTSETSLFPPISGQTLIEHRLREEDWVEEKSLTVSGMFGVRDANRDSIADTLRMVASCSAYGPEYWRGHL